jgi:hypothetical protein
MGLPPLEYGKVVTMLYLQVSDSRPTGRPGRPGPRGFEKCVAFAVCQDWVCEGSPGPAM